MSKIETVWFHSAVTCPNDANEMTHNVNADQTAPKRDVEFILVIIVNYELPVRISVLISYRQ